MPQKVDNKKRLGCITPQNKEDRYRSRKQSVRALIQSGWTPPPVAMTSRAAQSPALWILIAQEKVGGQANRPTDGQDRDRQRKCIRKAGSSDAVSSLPWEIKETVMTRF